jgi:hypothetical protein
MTNRCLPSLLINWQAGQAMKTQLTIELRICLQTAAYCLLGVRELAPSAIFERQLAAALRYLPR